MNRKKRKDENHSLCSCLALTNGDIKMIYRSVRMGNQKWLFEMTRKRGRKRIVIVQSEGKNTDCFSRRNSETDPLTCKSFQWRTELRPFMINKSL